jgi:hypothetical protein
MAAMATTAEGRLLFARRLVDLWGARTQRELLELVAAQVEGAPKTSASVGSWLRGETAPRSHLYVWALEEALETEPGYLSGPLGMLTRPGPDGPPPATSSSDSVLAQLAVLEDALALAVSAVRRLAEQERARAR